MFKLAEDLRVSFIYFIHLIVWSTNQFVINI